MKKLILSIFLFISILSPVYADSGSVDSVSAGYGYTQYLNDDITTRTFNTFSTSNLEQDLNTLPNKTTVYIDEFDLRFTVPNNFQANYKYTITFTWAGYKPSTSNAPFADGKSFYELFQYFDNIGRCRVSNWNGTNLESDSCFKNYSMSYVLNPNGLNDSTVEITITFTPKITFYGFTTYFNYGNLLADPRLPLNAWVIQDVDYSTNYISSSGGESGSTGGVTSNDINNIINNQTQNTQDIIDNQTQNTQDILDSNKETQDTINNNFNECRDSYNLYNYEDTTDVSSGITIGEDGWVTATFDNTTGTSIKYFNYYTNNLDLKTSTTYAVVLEVKNVSGTGRINPYSTNTAKTAGQFTTSNPLQFTSLSSNSINVFYPTTYSNFDSISKTMGIRTLLAFNQGQSGTITFRISVLADTSITSSNFKYEPYGEQICINRIDETNDKLNDLNNSLNNSDIIDAENDASNFFNNFTDSDNGGLSGIITSPLIAINKMLDSQCSPLTAIYKNKTISLSCGTEFWAKATGIKEFLNLVEGGLLCYLIIRKLYLLVQDLKNPDNDRVEVMKL